MFDVAKIAENVTLGDDGIWYSANQEQVSYPNEGHAACLQVEESSFWFKHRNACITAAVENYPPHMGGPIFDIGGGNGFVSLALRNAGFEVVLVEPGIGGARNAKRRGIPTVVCATTATAALKRGTLNAVGLFDVVEHIDDALTFLASIRSLMSDGASLYATVPAYPLLWSHEDETAGHFRRYRLENLKSELMSTGFAIEYATHFFRLLPLPIFLLRALPYRLGISSRANPRSAAASDHRAPSGSGALLDRLLAPEVANIRAHRQMRFGGSCLIVARAI